MSPPLTSRRIRLGCRRSTPEDAPHRSRRQDKETTMSALNFNLSRDLTCGAAAVLITMVFSATFAGLTAVAAEARGREAGHALALQLTHGWFGQPEPAGLVG